ncbi:translation initiation factor IF-2 N-terminal domain-containing protein [Prauserella flavalba]|uniref:Ribonuclease E n=1 Tax=Prauserella flavalba TaxID=1477506 RepID=A0A318LDA8_9PSEU|nr:Rne/Rng family ribonuclease [Prauserella flavalba]PXY22027.1 ribonuclease E [Prauserella flavalba]
MSNAETPAENTGGTTATSTAGALAELPNRVRVHALAKLLGSSSREVLAKLAELGETARSAQSSVAKDVALKVAGALGVLDEAVEEAAEAGGADTVTPPAPADPEQPAEQAPAASATPEPEVEPEPKPEPEPVRAPRPVHTPVFAAPSPVFLPPEPVAEPTPKKQEKTDRPEKTEKPEKSEKPEKPEPAEVEDEEQEQGADGESGEPGEGGRRRRRRGRRGRGRGKGGDDNATDEQTDTEAGEAKAEAEDTDEQAQKADEGADQDEADGEGGSKRRRRRRRRKGGDDDGADASGTDDPPNTVVHVRDGKAADNKSEARDGVRSVRGSTRLEAKRQRRRDGREAGRRRAPILSEAEFLARREAVERTMVVAERGDSTQIGVLEDGVLVEHFVTTSGSGSIVGNVYLGRVQNVLPSMEAAFIDIGRGRNAVLYAGEVDWDAAGLEGKARKIEQALSTGDNVLVQVTKDPVGHKGARLTTQISLPGRFLVYVPAGGATGISRKLPENERRRLKDILKRIVPEDAGVIIRTASEGISEEELARDVRRLKAQWEVIKEKADSSTGSGKKSSAPVLLYEEPDLLVKVVRDLFTEDFAKLEVQGPTAWETIHAYVEHVAPDLTDRLKRYVGNGDVFAEHRIDEQLTKALDRKVWLPSGGYLVIDRTEAMTVIDVNTGKFTGSGGNLEETVTRNNLESAEEIVRQLRLRDIGGIIVIDFIDMVLESNRELVLRRLTECLGRDRTRHQVAEVTSLGLVQMTRKRVGTGLLEAYSTTCEHCKGRGVIVSTEPNKGNGGGNGNGHQHGGGGGRRSRGRGKGGGGEEETARATETGPTPEQRESVVSAVQAMANASKAASGKSDEGDKADRAAEAPKAEPEKVTRPEKAQQSEQPREAAQREEKPEQLREAGQRAEPEQPVQAEPAAAEQPAEPEAAKEQPAEVTRPEQAEPVRAKRPTRASRPAGPPAVEHPAEPEQPEQAQPAARPLNGHTPAHEVGTPEPATAAVAEEQAAETEQPSVPAPAVRTTTRRPRRAASRPAGPPVHAQENG